MGNIMKFASICATFIAMMLTNNAHGNEWEKTELPSYTEGVSFLAIGSDGHFYSAISNENGYVFSSILETYKFEDNADSPFIVDIYARTIEIYLGKSCDIKFADLGGSWSNDSTGLNFRVDPSTGSPFFLRLLSTDLAPMHRC